MTMASLSKQLLLVSIFSLGAVGCGQSNNGGPSTGGTTSPVIGTGGAASGGGTGGRDGSGGTGGNSSGGTKGSGGASTSGGAQGTGGTAGSGGTLITGGSTSSGGALGTGGSSTIRTGGTSGAGTGGAGSGGRATGGAGGDMTGTGGTTKTGGNSGDASVGGSNGTGGSTTSGSGGGTGTTAATIVPDPSWTCGMPDGIPAPTLGTLAFSVSLTVSAIHDVGNTQFGNRRQLDVSGGTITGDKLKGTVLTGGLDYELTLSTGAMELEEVLILKTSDNVTIFTRVCGVAAAGDSVVRIVPDIEAPTAGSYAWLNTTKLVGTRTVDTAGSKITLDVYDVSNVTAGDLKIQLKDPAGVPNVSWDCVSATGTDGNSVFTENVTLGTTVSVSNAKRGSRNIIPITGGTTTGKVAGKILNGGADYQLAATGGSTTLDARYTLAPSDGNFIIVRNCGPMSSLVPVFEAASDGPYAFLTTGKFLSSAPGSGSGGVSITFYERK
jgi:hypothetical protein